MKKSTDIIIKNVAQFSKWVRFAKPGAGCVYHRGNLIADRDSAVAREEDRDMASVARVREIANFAAGLAAQDLVTLTQKRVSLPVLGKRGDVIKDGVCRYIAIKTKKPAAELSVEPAELLAA